MFDENHDQEMSFQNETLQYNDYDNDFVSQFDEEFDENNDLFKEEKEEEGGSKGKPIYFMINTSYLYGYSNFLLHHFLSFLFCWLYLCLLIPHKHLCCLLPNFC